MSEKAVLTVQAHVFQIDPETKKKWLPSSSAAVKVAYYHDPTRKTYRIIAIEGGKVRVSIML
jgi:homer protein